MSSNRLHNLDPTVDQDREQIRRITAYLNEVHQANIPSNLSIARKKERVLRFISQNPTLSIPELDREQQDGILFVSREEYNGDISSINDAMRGLIDRSQDIVAVTREHSQQIRDLSGGLKNLGAQLAELNDEFFSVTKAVQSAESNSAEALETAQRAEENSEKALAGPQSWISQLATGRLITATLGLIVGVIIFWYGVEDNWFDDMYLSNEWIVILGAVSCAVVSALFFGDLPAYRRTGFLNGVKKGWDRGSKKQCDTK